MGLTNGYFGLPHPSEFVLLDVGGTFDQEITAEQSMIGVVVLRNASTMGGKHTTTVQKNVIADTLMRGITPPLPPSGFSWSQKNEGSGWQGH